MQPKLRLLETQCKNGNLNKTNRALEGDGIDEF